MKDAPWSGSLAAVPGILFALLPRGTCPACLAAYSSLLLGIGVGALYEARLVAPLTLAFLVVGVLGVGWSGRSHRRRGPLLVTLAGSALVVAGRFAWELTALVYAGAAALAAGSLWNLWLKRPVPQPLVRIERTTGGSCRSS